MAQCLTRCRSSAVSDVYRRRIVVVLVFVGVSVAVVGRLLVVVGGGGWCWCLVFRWPVSAGGGV